MDAFFQMLCLCGAMASPPQPQPVREVGVISYRYEVLSGRKYLLRLSTTDLILDSDSWRETRMRNFAEQFADRTCHGRFQLAAVVLPSWPKNHPLYTKQFLFRCR
jgi:hypothetical protein